MNILKSVLVWVCVGVIFVIANLVFLAMFFATVLASVMLLFGPWNFFGGAVLVPAHHTMLGNRHWQLVWHIAIQLVGQRPQEFVHRKTPRRSLDG